jgi:hypothetical protein
VHPKGVPPRTGVVGQAVEGRSWRPWPHLHCGASPFTGRARASHLSAAGRGRAHAGARRGRAVKYRREAGLKDTRDDRGRKSPPLGNTVDMHVLSKDVHIQQLKCQPICPSKGSVVTGTYGRSLEGESAFGPSSFDQSWIQELRNCDLISIVLASIEVAPTVPPPGSEASPHPSNADCIPRSPSRRSPSRPRIAVAFGCISSRFRDTRPD